MFAINKKEAPIGTQKPFLSLPNKNNTKKIKQLNNKGLKIRLFQQRKSA